MKQKPPNPPRRWSKHHRRVIRINEDHISSDHLRDSIEAYQAISRKKVCQKVELSSPRCFRLHLQRQEVEMKKIKKRDKSAQQQENEIIHHQGESECHDQENEITHHAFNQAINPSIKQYQELLEHTIFPIIPLQSVDHSLLAIPTHCLDFRFLHPLIQTLSHT